MRSSLIIATFALAVIAAPIPEAKPIFKGNGEGCVRRVGNKCSIRTRDLGDVVETDVEARYAELNTRGKNPPQSPYISAKTVQQRDLAKIGADASSTESVPKEQRSPAMSRNKNSRSADEDEQEDLSNHPIYEQRSPTMSRNKNSRSADGDEQEDLTSHPVHNEQRSPAMSRNKNSRSVEYEEEEEDEEKEGEDNSNEARSVRGGGSNKRSAEPEPINRSLHSRDARNTASGPTIDHQQSKRVAVAEPLLRLNAFSN